MPCGHNLPVAGNRPDRNFTAQQANQAYVWRHHLCPCPGGSVALGSCHRPVFQASRGLVNGRAYTHRAFMAFGHKCGHR